MRDRAGRRGLRRLAAGAAAAALATASLAAAVPSASASSTPTPDFDFNGCVVDIIAYTCFFTGSATGGGEIVDWRWQFPGSWTPNGSGQSTSARYDNLGTDNVTLTVTDNAGRTGSITKPVQLTEF